MPQGSHAADESKSIVGGATANVLACVAGIDVQVFGCCPDGIGTEMDLQHSPFRYLKTKQI